MTDEEIRRLLARKAESANLDYKQGFAWTKENRDKKYELVRDLIALANTKDGGRVIVGVRDGDFDFVGLPAELYDSLDPNNIVQMLHDNAAPKVNCEVIKRVIDGRNVIVLDVAEFEDTPVICTNSMESSDSRRLILRQAAIYVRTAAATTEEITSPDEMRTLIGRAMTRKGDELLQTIQRLLTGKPTPAAEATRELYQKQVDSAHEFLEQQLGEELRRHGYIEVIAYPTNYIANRIQTLADARSLVQGSEVALRGWNFPHTDKEQAGPFADGAQSTTIWERYREGYRLYRSGLFLWKRVYWEDAEETRTSSGRRTLSFISGIYSFTEYLLFLMRLYEQVMPDGAIHLSITLYGCRDRELAAFDPSIHFWPGHACSEDVIPQEEDIKVVDLRASYLEIAARLVKHVFHVFNWLDVADTVIQDWQQRLLKRQF